MGPFKLFKSSVFYLQLFVDLKPRRTQHGKRATSVTVCRKLLSC